MYLQPHVSQQSKVQSPLPIRAGLHNESGVELEKQQTYLLPPVGVVFDADPL
jgi:hypothetical protein